MQLRCFQQFQYSSCTLIKYTRRHISIAETLNYSSFRTEQRLKRTLATILLYGCCVWVLTTYLPQLYIIKCIINYLSGMTIFYLFFEYIEVINGRLLFIWINRGKKGRDRKYYTDLFTLRLTQLISKERDLIWSLSL